MKKLTIARKRIALLFSFLFFFIGLYHAILSFSDINEYPNVVNVWRLILFGPKSMDFWGTEIDLPRGSLVTEWDEEDDKIVSMISINKNEFIGVAKWKNIEKNTMIEIFRNEVNEFARGDILARSYVYSSDSGDICILYRMGWDYESPTDGFPMFSEIVIPDKKIILYYGPKEHTISDVLDKVKQSVFHNSSMKFILDMAKTKEYNPWAD